MGVSCETDNLPGGSAHAPQRLRVFTTDCLEISIIDTRYTQSFDLREFGVTRYSNLDSSLFFITETQTKSTSELDEIGPLIEEVISLARQINLEVNSYSIQELLDSCNQKLTINKPIEMHEQERDIEELKVLDPVQAEDRITVGNLTECLSLIEKAPYKGQCNLARLHPNLERKYPNGSQGPPTALPLPPTSRDDLQLNGYFEYPNTIIRLQTCRPFQRFEPNPHGIAVSVTNRFPGWAA
ncbi:uncharacterized protein TNCV_2768711 [Trichonephila clavipes]|nr:uncharacterized protein TNCV_2768711 [Trichonephila clavipes]